MSCCESFLKPSYPLASTSDRYKSRRRSPADVRGWTFFDVPDFSEFSLKDLRAVTDNFSADFIISECGEKSPNVVYKGRLPHNGGLRWIVVKKFEESAWPDSNQFAAEAGRVGKLRHKRLANLIGYCCDGDERLLVAEYMPNNSLSKHLFHWEKQSIRWNMLLRIALYVAEALCYCNQSGRSLYHDLNAYRVLLDENGDPRLSCFGLMKNSRDGKSFSSNLAYTPPEYLINGTFTAKSVIFSFGTVLLDLLSGKHVPPSHALEMIRSRKIKLLIDSQLEGKFSTEEATMVFDLASKCLQNNPMHRPEPKELVSTLGQIQNKLDVPSHVMLGIPESKEAPMLLSCLSPIADACSRMDLTAIHQILISREYKDDKGTSELSFHRWAQQVKEMLDARKNGDFAFQDKDFETAIENYSKFIEVGAIISPTVYARRCICYLLTDQPDAALRDAMQAQCVLTDWPIAFYLQSMALKKLNMHEDAANMLKEAASSEERKLKSSN